MKTLKKYSEDSLDFTNILVDFTTEFVKCNKYTTLNMTKKYDSETGQANWTMPYLKMNKESRRKIISKLLVKMEIAP